MSVRVLRLDHRPIRDKRITTHLILAARAFGALGAIYSGKRDLNMEETVSDVIANWGGPFSLNHTNNWRKTITGFKGKVIHLTMYGLPIQEIINSIKEDPSEKLVIVGGKKVSREVYDLTDWNISVTQQPHSEVSALAVFLHELFEGEELTGRYQGAKLRIIPREQGKLVKKSPKKKIEEGLRFKSHDGAVI
jgi:tRNA (cytidine56-2'-O)-methyltransferase